MSTQTQKKRFLALWLTLVMLVGMLPANALESGNLINLDSVNMNIDESAAINDASQAQATKDETQDESRDAELSKDIELSGNPSEESLEKSEEKQDETDQESKDEASQSLGESDELGELEEAAEEKTPIKPENAEPSGNPSEEALEKSEGKLAESQNGETSSETAPEILMDEPENKPDPTPVIKVYETDNPDDVFQGMKEYTYEQYEPAKELTGSYESAVEGGTWTVSWIRPPFLPKDGDPPWGIDIYGASITPRTEHMQKLYYYFKAVYTLDGESYTTYSDPIPVSIIEARVVQEPKINTPLAEKTRYAQNAEDVQNLLADVTAIGKEPDKQALAYQWYVSDAKSNENGSPIEGATQASYTPPVNEMGTKYYYYIVTATQGEEVATTTTSNVAAIIVSNIPFEGEGTLANPYQLSKVEDFQAVAENVAQGESFKDQYFVLQNDLTIPIEWKGIGSLKPGTTDANEGVNLMPFSGTLDGNGNTLTFEEGSKALFRFVRNATIENLNIYAPYMADYALVSEYPVDYGENGNYNNGDDLRTADFKNITLKSGSIIQKGGFIGGEASGKNEVNFSNSTVEKGVKIGFNKNANASSGESNVGSFAGAITGTFINCVSYADVYGADNVGGIAGAKSQSMGLYSFRNCAFYGNIEASGDNVGGIAGSGYTNETAPNTPAATIEKNLVVANITGRSNIGGIYGGEGGLVQNWDEATIKNNAFKGTITATSGNETVGGIIGYMHSLNKYNIVENNYYNVEGINKGIGKVSYIDTSSKTQENTNGITYFDTSLSLPGITGVSNKDHNRTDDPMGIDADKLTKSMTTEQFADGSVTALLNASGGGWKQGENGYPIHDENSLVANSLSISGTYKDTYFIGESLDMSEATFTISWSDGSETHPAFSDLTITGFDNSTRGVQKIRLSYGGAKTEIKVTVLIQPTLTNQITVGFTLLGDSIHSEDTVHTLSNGGLTTWIPRTSFKMDVNTRVKDVFEEALSRANISWSNPEGNYVKSITKDGITLAEFTNGQYSGWMYTINGIHSNLGIDEQFLNDGDEIVWHYTDDYTKEEGSEKWNNIDEEKVTLAPQASVENGKGKVSLDLATLKDAIANAKSEGRNIIIAPTTSENLKSMEIALQNDALKTIAKNTSSGIVVKTSIGTITLPNDVLVSIEEQAAGSSITITIDEIENDKNASNKSENSQLTAEQKALVGENKVYAISILTDGKNITGFDGNDITISLPYTLQEGQIAEGVQIWYLNDKNELENMKATYNETDKLASFKVDHLSKFVVGYEEKAEVEETDWVNPFTDVKESDWFYKAVEFTVSRDIFGGMTETSFEPNTPMTRAMLVTVLHRLDGAAETEKTSVFKDVKESDWYAESIAWANANKIATGIGKGQFGPNNNVTREQMAAILQNYVTYKGYDLTETTDLSTYADLAAVSDWAMNAIRWANAEGLITGRSESTLAPKGQATRAEVAAILQRFVEKTETLDATPDA